MGRPGLPELLLILLVVLLLFGAKRLPDLSRSVGRSLRILKSETKALHADDDEPAAAERPRGEITGSEPAPAQRPGGSAGTGDPATASPVRSDTGDAR